MKGTFIMTDNVEIKLSKEQYETLIKFLYFADYCADRGFMSEFKSTDDRNKLFDVITHMYEYGDRINLPKSFSMTSMASEVRFSEDEALRLQKQVEADIEDIARNCFAYNFAKQDLKKMLNALGDDDIELIIMKRELISKRAQIYIKEFENNGINNLRFKMFYNLRDDESDE